jgi:hypothetical protein
MRRHERIVSGTQISDGRDAIDHAHGAGAMVVVVGAVKSMVRRV